MQKQFYLLYVYILVVYMTFLNSKPGLGVGSLGVLRLASAPQGSACQGQYGPGESIPNCKDASLASLVCCMLLLHVCMYVRMYMRITCGASVVRLQVDTVRQPVWRAGAGQRRRRPQVCAGFEGLLWAPSFLSTCCGDWLWLWLWW